ncbi:MAG TPA: PEGA domain-containing protein, partial [Kofleriaceae bacterium]
IDPTPEGARGHIADDKGVVAKEFGPTSHKTPVRLAVQAGLPFRIHIELEGYEPHEQVRTIKEGEIVVIAPELRKAKATLKVTTTPEGAQVSLKGKLLGETPLDRNDLAATKGELVISKPGFEPFKQKIELVAGKTVEITQTLKAGAKYGTLHIRFKGAGWAEVYYKGTPLGRAPNRDAFRVPIGKQTLQLVNTGKTPHLKWTVTCEVSEGETKTCTTALP